MSTTNISSLEHEFDLSSVLSCINTASHSDSHTGTERRCGLGALFTADPISRFQRTRHVFDARSARIRTGSYRSVPDWEYVRSHVGLHEESAMRQAGCTCSRIVSNSGSSWRGGQADWFHLQWCHIQSGHPARLCRAVCGRYSRARRNHAVGPQRTFV